MPTDRSIIEARLTEAEAAYHAVTVGRREVEVSYGMGDSSRTVKYTPADADKLLGYIKDLKQALGLASRRAIGVRFS